MKGYGIFSLLYLTISKIGTYYISRKSRLMRLPIFIRNSKFIDFGTGLTTGVGCRLDAFSECATGLEPLIVFGKNVQINDYVHIAAYNKVYIGDNVLIASKVFISDHDHGNYSGIVQCHPNTPPHQRPLHTKPVHINKNVWIGEFVSILPGVSIGEGAIIGANSVVTRNVPSFSIAVGSPAKVIKTYDFDKKKWLRI